MKIRKTFVGNLPDNKIVNSNSTSETDTYSCKYLNERNVIVSSEEPTTGEEVWLEKGKNLFNKENITLDYRLDSQGQPFLHEGAGVFISDFIEVEPNTTYIASWYVMLMKAVAYYDSDKNFILRNTDTNPFTTTNETKYIKICGYQSDLEKLVLEKGDTITTKKIHTKTDNGYEEFYNEEEQLLKSNIIIENVTLPEITITSGTRTNTYKSVAKDGYTPLGIVGIDGTNDYVSMGKFLINPSNETAYVTVVNSNVNSQTTKITLTVLYIKK